MEYKYDVFSIFVPVPVPVRDSQVESASHAGSCIVYSPSLQGAVLVIFIAIINILFSILEKINSMLLSRA